MAQVVRVRKTLSKQQQQRSTTSRTVKRNERLAQVPLHQRTTSLVLFVQ